METEFAGHPTRNRKSVEQEQKKVLLKAREKNKIFLSQALAAVVLSRVVQYSFRHFLSREILALGALPTPRHCPLYFVCLQLTHPKRT